MVQFGLVATLDARLADDTEDMRYFYPTSVMQTGYDILFFWVARMIMMGLEDTGQIPFPHGVPERLIRDEQGQKMSKMRGTSSTR